MEYEWVQNMEEKFKSSRYNLITEVNPDSFLVANTLTNGIIRLNHLAREILDNKIIQPKLYPPWLFSLLLDNGFIIADSVNELTLLEERHFEARKGKMALGLTVGVTQNCNFACTYCYQQHQPLDLPYDVQQGIINYVKRKLPGREVFMVAWWGGEPLLRLDIIQKLSSELRNLCDNYGCEYSAAITTNGYLLSEDTAKNLVDLGVCDVQVTIDGPPKIHNQRRCLNGGGGSFDRIFENLLTNAHLFERVFVRINIDKYNADSIENLLDILTPLKQWITIAFRAVTSSETPNCSAPGCLSGPDYWTVEDKLSIMASQKGFRLNFGFSIPGTSFCTAYQTNSIMVDAYGDVHRCPVCIGRRQDRMGILNEDGTISDLGGIQLKWDNWNPFEDSECRDCFALPVCMGGCLWYLGMPKDGAIRCFVKHNLIDRMKSDDLLTSLPVHIY